MIRRVGAYSIGVDLGGTNLRIAAVSEDGHMLERIALPTAVKDGPGRVVQDMVDAIEAVRDRFAGSDLRGVGVAVPGFVDVYAGIMMVSVNLPGFERFPIRDEVQRRLHTPILLENDGNAAALAEKWIGAGRNHRDLVLLTLGTGIGGGIITDGQIMRGPLGMAGEIGHMTIYPDGNPCGCGNFGCLEKHASASAISAMANMMGIEARKLDSEELHKIALAGNEKAQMVFDSVGRALGIAIANLANLLNYPLYLLSGGPLAAWDQFAPAMFQEVRKRSFVFRDSEARIEKAILGSNAGLLGAAYLPFLELGRSSTPTEQVLYASSVKVMTSEGV